MRIKTSSFCSLSRHEAWQSWLGQAAPDLLTDLDNTIKSRKGCRANSDKMMAIYHELYKRKLGNQFEKFISEKFPWLVENGPSRPTNKFPTVIKRTELKESNSDLNKHQVFTSYRPHLLDFPQKLIIVDTPQNLYKRVQGFVQDKIGVDYIIIDDHAYIEYFEPKYAGVVDRIKRENREIYRFRQRSQQSETSNTNRQHQ